MVRIACASLPPPGHRWNGTPALVVFRFGEWKGMRRPNGIARDEGDLPHPNCSGLAAGT